MVNSFFKRLRSLSQRPGKLWIKGQCILCADKGQDTADICQACETDLPRVGHQCLRCALPLTDADQTECGQCLQAPPPFQRTHAPWLYQPPTAQLISAFKYRRHYSCGRTLAIIASASIVSAYKYDRLPDIITPTPLHWYRHLQRGFNQSEHLASVFAKQLHRPMQHLLKRNKATPAQQLLNARKRRQNLRGAFQVIGEVQGKTVAVVDDVMTTGATVSEISQVLLNAGAKEVHIWVLARTPH
jgi:ComF family protein